MRKGQWESNQIKSQNLRARELIKIFLSISVRVLQRIRTNRRQIEREKESIERYDRLSTYLIYLSILSMYLPVSGEALWSYMSSGQQILKLKLGPRKCSPLVLAECHETQIQNCLPINYKIMPVCIHIRSAHIRATHIEFRWRNLGGGMNLGGGRPSSPSEPK